MSQTFFETLILPLDVQAIIVGNISTPDLFKKCLSASKAIRACAIVTLLSRRDPESLRYQEQFLHIWKRKPECFIWISTHKTALAKALCVLIEDPVVNNPLRYLAITVLATITATTAIPRTELDEAIKNAELHDMLQNLKNGDRAVRQQACRRIPIIAGSLSLATVQTLLPEIIERLQDEYKDIQEAAAPAFAAVFAILPTERQTYYLEKNRAMLSDEESQARWQACLRIATMVDSLSAEAVEALLPEIIERLRDEYSSDVRVAAAPTFAALFAKLPAAQRPQYLEPIQSMLCDEGWRIRQQACRTLSAIVSSLSAASAETLLPMIMERLRDKYSDVRDAAVSAFAALLAKLPTAQQAQYLEKIQAMLSDKEWYIRWQACLSISDVVHSMSAASAETLLPEIIELLSDEDSDVRDTAASVYTALFAKLPATQRQHYLEKISPLLSDDDWSIRRQACRIISTMVHSLTVAFAETLLPKIIERLQDKDRAVRASAAPTFVALFAKLPVEQQAPFLESIQALLSDEDWRIRQQVCLSISGMMHSLPAALAEKLLPKIIELLRDEGGYGAVRKAATPAALTALLATFPAAQREPYLQSVLSRLDFQAPDAARQCHETLSLLADAFSAQQLRTLLPMLLSSLSDEDISPYACLTLKRYIAKSRKDPAEQPSLLSIYNALSKLLCSPEGTTRQAALEIATFPGILRLWTAENLPKEKFLECLYLQKMQGLSQLLWPKKLEVDKAVSAEYRF